MFIVDKGFPPDGRFSVQDLPSSLAHFFWKLYLGFFLYDDSVFLLRVRPDRRRHDGIVRFCSHSPFARADLLSLVIRGCSFLKVC